MNCLDLQQPTATLSKANIYKFYIKQKNRITLKQGNIFTLRKGSRQGIRFSSAVLTQMLCLLLVALEIFSGMQMHIQRVNNYA